MGRPKAKDGNRQSLPIVGCTAATKVAITAGLRCWAVAANGRLQAGHLGIGWPGDMLAAGMLAAGWVPAKWVPAGTVPAEWPAG